MKKLILFLFFLSPLLVYAGSSNHIKLELTPDGAEYGMSGSRNLPKGNFTVLYEQGDSPWQPQFEFTISGLYGFMRGNNAYALYIAPTSWINFDPNQLYWRKLIFNTDVSGSWHKWDGMPSYSTLTTFYVWVAVESDDGRHFDPTSDASKVLLTGSITLDLEESM